VRSASVHDSSLLSHALHVSLKKVLSLAVSRAVNDVGGVCGGGAAGIPSPLCLRNDTMLYECSTTLTSRFSLHLFLFFSCFGEHRNVPFWLAANTAWNAHEPTPHSTLLGQPLKKKENPSASSTDGGTDDAFYPVLLL
jgi:hypothetical protein